MDRWFEIATVVEIADKPGLNRTPSQLALRSCARSWHIHAGEKCEPAKMIGCLFRRLGNDRQVKTSAYGGSNVFERHTLFGDP